MNYTSKDQFTKEEINNLGYPPDLRGVDPKRLKRISDQALYKDKVRNQVKGFGGYGLGALGLYGMGDSLFGDGGFGQFVAGAGAFALGMPTASRYAAIGAGFAALGGYKATSKTASFLTGKIQNYRDDGKELGVHRTIDVGPSRETNFKRTRESRKRKLAKSRAEAGGAKYFDPSFLDTQRSTKTSQQTRRAGIDGTRTPGYGRTGSYNSEWGFTKHDLATMSPDQMSKRAGGFLFGGYGYKREVLQNSFGILSKAQKSQGPFNFNNMQTRAFGLWTALEAATSDAPISEALNAGATYVLGAAGFRYGQAKSMAAQQRAAGRAQLGKVANIRSAIRGGIIGGALIGAYEGTKYVAGRISEFADEAYRAEFKHDVHTTEEGLTMRQRALGKISKAGLNDRNTMLGNEASVLFS